MISHDAPSPLKRKSRLPGSSLFSSGSFFSAANDGDDGGLDVEFFIPLSDLELEDRPFAAGGAGMIFKGTFKKRFRVAAKAIFSSLVAGDSTEFEQELSVLKSLRHRNIVRLYGVAKVPFSEQESDDTLAEKLYIITELCSSDLADEIRPELAAETGYSPARLADWAAQLLDGVAYMHRAGYAHCDLKPSNVLVTVDGIIKICDLGMAKSVRGKAAILDVGTYAYMPPEAFSSAPSAMSTLSAADGDHYDATKWDVYSLAVILVELWVGVHPWKDLDADQVSAKARLGQRPDFPSHSEGPPQEHVRGCSCDDDSWRGGGGSSGGGGEEREQQLYEDGLLQPSPLLFLRPPPPLPLRALVHSMWTQEPRHRPAVEDVLSVFRSSRDLFPRLAKAKNWVDMQWENEGDNDLDRDAMVAAIAPSEAAVQSGGASGSIALENEDPSYDFGPPREAFYVLRSSSNQTAGEAAAQQASSASFVTSAETLLSSSLSSPGLCWSEDPACVGVELINGWNPRGGDAHDRRRALTYFAPALLPLAVADHSEKRQEEGATGQRPRRFTAGNSLRMPSTEDMCAWYLDGQTARGSPWCLVNRPRKWRLEGFNKSPMREKQQQQQQQQQQQLRQGDSQVKVPSNSPSNVVQGAVLLSTSTTFFFDVDECWEQVRLPLLGPRRTKWLVWAYLSPTKRLLRCLDGFVSDAEREFPFALATVRLVTVNSGDGPIRDGGGRESMHDCTVVVPDECAGSSNSSTGSRARPYRPSLLIFDLESPWRGAVQIRARDQEFRILKEEGPGFFNARAPFRVLGGLVDVGNHMSFLRLSGQGDKTKRGKFLVVDALDPNGPSSPSGRRQGGELREEIDRLTRGGRLMEAVVATHPFHTVGFLPFFAVYGDQQRQQQEQDEQDDREEHAETESNRRISSNERGRPRLPLVRFYGTPRHLRRFPEIPWAGDLSDVKVRALWESEGVEMRLPCGTEFEDPQPPASNHFSNVFVFHRASRCVHNDDCLAFYDSPARKMGLLVSALGVRHGQLSFHPSLTGPGLDDPRAFESWMDQLLTDWNFETLCTAHNGVLRGGANERCRTLLHDTAATFGMLAARIAARGGEGAAAAAFTEEEQRKGEWAMAGGLALGAAAGAAAAGANCECG